MAGKKATSRKRVAKKKASARRAGSSRKTAARKAAKKRKTTKTVSKKSARKKTSAKKAAKKKTTRKKASARKPAARKAKAKKKVAKKKKVTKKKAAPKRKKATAKAKPKAKAKAKKKTKAKPKAKKTAAKSAKKKAVSKKPAQARRRTPAKMKARRAPARARPLVPRKARRGVASDQLIHGIAPYRPAAGEEYMSDTQLEHFRRILLAWKRELMEEVDRTVHHMQDEASNFPDPNDRATQESEFGLELRTRDRERKLLKKIESALGRIDDGSYGFCEETGEEIGLKRLEARPVATLCVEAQERRELAERQYRDRDDQYR